MTNFFENNTATITNSETQTSKTIGFHLKNLLAEPLVQFLILGAIIFAVDGYISANHRDNPYLIHIDDKKLSELITIFEEGQGRMPSTKEVENMIVQWSQNEILFREGQQLSLHKGDEMIRSRLILKMRNILLNSVVIEVPTEKQLKMWFDQFKDNYKIPASISLELTVAATSEVEAKATAAELNHADHAAAKNLYNIRRYQNRPVNSLTAFFNESGQQQIEQAAINQWLPVQTQKGEWRVARVVQRTAAKPVEYQQARAKVVKDWQQFSKAQQLSAQTKVIADQYKVIIDPSEQLLDKYDINYLSAAE